jgi:tungstate transport system substrate-binding protein
MRSCAARLRSCIFLVPFLFPLLCPVLLLAAQEHVAPKTVEPPGNADDARPVVRVAIVGGLVLCGVWPELARRAEAATGLTIETVAAAPKEGVVPAFREGEADLLLIHGGDETHALEAAGYAAPLRVWGRNEHVIVGPPDDPAGVATASSAAQALARIIQSDAPMIGFRDPGSFAVVQELFRAHGLRPGARQHLFDESETPRMVLRFAASKHAYVVVGHIPVAFGRMPNAGLKVLFRGDPAMRRAYVLVEPGPRHPATPERREQARRLAAYLLGPAGQSALQEADRAAGGPWVFPNPIHADTANPRQDM